MSSSELRIETGVPSSEITLLDHSGTVVATSRGSLHEAGLDAGLYRVQVTAAATVAEQLVPLHDGDSVFRYVRLTLPMVTPVKDAAVNHGLHARPASDLSVHPSLDLGAGGRLVVFARVLRPLDDLPAHELPEVSLRGLQLLDLQGTPLDPTWLVREATGPGYAGISVDLFPGSYLLRAPEVDGTADQVVVVVDGWTTYLFLPAWPPPEDQAGQPWAPAAEAMVVHLKARGERFEPYDHGSDAFFAAEAALDGLRTGHVVLPDGSWKQTLTTHVRMNPMLGIYLGHALLNRPGLSPTIAGPSGRAIDRGTAAVLRRVEDLVGRLEDAVRQHPDVVALRCAVEDRRAAARAGHPPEPGTIDLAFATPVRPLTSPPMLRASYHALLARDIGQPDLLVEGSFAELAATRLRCDSLWARWDSLSDDPDRVEVDRSAMTGTVTALEGIVDMSELRDPLMEVDITDQRFDPHEVRSDLAHEEHVGEAGHGADQMSRDADYRGVLPPPMASPAPLPEPAQGPAQGPATVPREVAEIAETLRRMSEYPGEEGGHPISVADLSRRLGLPVSLVRAALATILRRF